MNVREMAKQYLEDHGCDGLRHPLLNCWCSLEMCERCSMMMVCVPARRMDGVLVPVPDDQLGPTRQERVERKLRGALNDIVRLAGQGMSNMCLAITHLAEFALDWVPENEDMDRAVEDLPGKESDDERIV